MTSEPSNIEALCAECKSDLTKEQHKDECTIFIKQREIALAKQKEIDDKVAADKAKLEADLKEKNEIKSNEDANKKIIDELKIEIRKADDEKKVMRLKNTIIDRIKALAPQENVPRDIFIKKFSLEQLTEIYQKTLELIKEEKKLKLKVSCPTCAVLLGYCNTRTEAKDIQNQHRKEKHPSSSTASWIVTAILLSLLAAGAYAGFSYYKKHQKKKDDQ